MEQQIASKEANPLTTALIAGLIWGLGFSLWDNLPGFLQENPLKHLRLRLQGLTYTTILYCLLFASILGVVGLVVWGVLALIRRWPSRTHLLAAYLGLAGAATVAALWLQRYGLLGIKRPETGHWVRWALIGLGSIVLGSLAGWLLYMLGRWWRTARRNAPIVRWGVMRNAVVALFLAGLLSLLLLGIYRAYLRDLPIFQPRPTGEVATPEQPNIILITIDTLRADHLGAYGYDPEISPNIDALAQRGIVFQQAIAQSSWTLQSVSSFITSLYPTELQIYWGRGNPVTSTRVDAMRTTMAEVMKEAGYRTQAYLNNVWLQPKNGFLQGFDRGVHFRDSMAFDLSPLLQRPLIKFLSRYSPRFKDIFQRGYRCLFDPDFRKSDGNEVNYYARRFLRLHREERFFLWLYYMEPHSIYNPEEPFHPLPEAITPARERMLRTIDFLTLGDIGPLVLTPTDLRALVSLYNGEIVDVDRLIGQIMEELETQGLTDRTLVVLMADHGEEFMDHGGYTHGGNLYQETIRVPLIFSGPPVAQPGRVVETRVALLDLLPTLADLVGVPIPSEARGRSLMPILQGELLEGRPIYSEGLHRTPFDLQSVIHQDYKLIYSASKQQVELYNLGSDPQEQTNLAETEPAKREELMALLQAWMERSQAAAQTLPRQSPAQVPDQSFIRLLRQGGY